MKKFFRASSYFTIVWLVIIVFLLSSNITIVFYQVGIFSNEMVYTDKQELEVDNTKNIIIEENNSTIVEDLKEEYNNQDVIGVLTIEDTSINEVVMQTKDNEYYLSHDKDKSYNIYGSIYMDYRINLASSKKIIIYGHSAPYVSINKVPFNELEEYYDKEFYDKHKYIKLELDNEVREYEIFSVYVEVEDFSYMNLNFDSEYKYLNHLLKLKNKSLYEINVDIDSDDEILILQTCSNNKKYTKYKNKYLVVIAKRIK